MDWTGLWTGLDWTDQKAVYNTDSERRQGYNSSSPALPQVAVEASVPRFLRGQRSRALSKNELQLWS